MTSSENGKMKSPRGGVKDEEMDDEDTDSMECVICSEHIQNKWHSVWITHKNAKQYMECFANTTGYDGKRLGRACRSCYNRFFSFSHSKKYSNVLCICCLKELSKRSYPFASFADVYRSLFPNIDPDAISGRVCTTCYDKGYNARQGILPVRQTKKRTSITSSLTRPSSKRQKLDQNVPSSNTDEEKETTEEELSDEEIETSEREDIATYRTRSTASREKSNSASRVHFEIITVASERRVFSINRMVKRNISYEELHELVADLIVAVPSRANHLSNKYDLRLLENDKTGELLEVLLTKQCLKQFPLENNCQVRVVVKD